MAFGKRTVKPSELFLPVAELSKFPAHPLYRKLNSLLADCDFNGCVENPTDDDLRRVDRGRKGKKLSYQDGESPSEPDSRIARMKDGTIKLAYTAEHAVDLENEAIVAGQVTRANCGATQTCLANLDPRADQFGEERQHRRRPRSPFFFSRL